MFLSFKALEQSGVSVKPKTDGLILIPENHWSPAAVEYFDNFSTEIMLDARDRDELADMVCDLTLMKTIKGCLTPIRDDK